MKTRLAAVTSPAWACRVYEAFLLDALDRLASFAVRRVIALDPPESRPYFEGVAAGRFEMTAQTAGDLGARLSAFLDGEFKGGAKAVVVVGADSPTLPAAMIAQAYTELARADLVLGPAFDGGYYLIGMRGWHDVLDGVAMSTDAVLDGVLAVARRKGTAVTVLEPTFDVDGRDDLRLLAALDPAREDLVATRRALAGMAA